MDFEFIKYIKDEWFPQLKRKNIDDVIKSAGGADKVMVLSVDMIVGFCCKGRLASPRINAIIRPIINLFKLSYSKGIRDFILTQDLHSEDSEEFKQFGPHAVGDSEEADTIEEIKGLDFFNLFKIFPKKTISSFTGTKLEGYIKSKDSINTFIIVGNCTDLCVYQLALALKLISNEGKLKWNIVLPEECSATYHLSVEDAEKINTLPHCGDTLRLIFLYHMSLNGIEVVKKIV